MKYDLGTIAFIVEDFMPRMSKDSEAYQRLDDFYSNINDCLYTNPDIQVELSEIPTTPETLIEQIDKICEQIKTEVPLDFLLIEVNKHINTLNQQTEPDHQYLAQSLENDSKNDHNKESVARNYVISIATNYNAKELEELNDAIKSVPDKAGKTIAFYGDIKSLEPEDFIERKERLMEKLIQAGADPQKFRSLQERKDLIQLIEAELQSGYIPASIKAVNQPNSPEETNSRTKFNINQLELKINQQIQKCKNEKVLSKERTIGIYQKLATEIFQQKLTKIEANEKETNSYTNGNKQLLHFLNEITKEKTDLHENKWNKSNTIIPDDKKPELLKAIDNFNTLDKAQERLETLLVKCKNIPNKDRAYISVQGLGNIFTDDSNYQRLLKELDDQSSLNSNSKVIDLNSKNKSNGKQSSDAPEWDR